MWQIKDVSQRSVSDCCCGTGNSHKESLLEMGGSTAFSFQSQAVAKRRSNSSCLAFLEWPALESSGSSGTQVKHLLFRCCWGSLQSTWALHGKGLSPLLTCSTYGRVAAHETCYFHSLSLPKFLDKILCHGRYSLHLTLGKSTQSLTAFDGGNPKHWHFPFRWHLESGDRQNLPLLPSACL